MAREDRGGGAKDDKVGVVGWVGLGPRMLD